MRSRPTSDRPVRSVALYAASMLFVSAANFLIVPLLIMALGSDSFATWALLEPLALAAIPVAGFGIHLGLMHQGRLSSDAASRAIDQLWVPYLVTAGAWGLAIASLAISFGTSIDLAIMLGAIVWAEGILLLLVTVFRVRNQPLLFAIMEGGRTTMVLVVMTAIIFFSPIEASLLLYLSIRMAAAVIALATGYRIIRPGCLPSWESCFGAVRYGAPIVVGSMVIVLLTNYDRYALLLIGAQTAMTDYTAHSKLSQTLAFATAPFFMWFAPLVMAKLHLGREAHAFFINATSGAVVMTTLAAGTLWLIAPLIWKLLFPSVQYDDPLFAIMILGAATFALGNTFSIGTLAGGQTHNVIAITGVSVLSGIGVVFLMGWALGPEGVATGRAAGMLVYTTLFATFTAISLNIRYPWKKYGVLLTSAASLALIINRLWPATSALNTILTTSLFITIIMLVACVIWKDDIMSEFNKHNSSL